MSITPVQMKKEPDASDEESKNSHVSDMLAIVIQGQSPDRQMEADVNAMNGYGTSFGKQVSNIDVRHS